MLFAPELEKQFRAKAGEPMPAMNGNMAAPAERDVQYRPVLPGVPMVDDQVLIRPTELATAIPLEDPFPLPGKTAQRVPAPVVAGATQPLGEQRVAATGAAPEGSLSAGSRIERRSGTHTSV